MSEEKKNIQQEELTEEELTEQRQIRRQKLKDLQEAGRNPFLIEKWDINAYSQSVKDNFDEMDGSEVSMAGRIMAKRVMGKASFIDIQDSEGRIQCHVKRDLLGQDEYKWFKTYDIGDIIGIEGKVFRTQRGEITIEVTKMVLLSNTELVPPWSTSW